MQFSLVENNFLVRFELGEEFHSQIVAFARKHEIKGGTYFGIGACSDVELGFYDLENKSYIRKQFSDEMEICNLTGNLSWKDGELYPHTHASLGKKDFSMIGGHVFKMHIGATCEVLLRPHASKIDREMDEKIGLGLLKMCSF